MQDAVLNTTAGYYDFSLDGEGQIVVDDFFDTALLYSLYGEQRADVSEMPETSLQRGWIGNEGADYENGSKLWLYHQSRITRTVLNNLQNAATLALKWLVTDSYAESVQPPVAIADNTGATLTITIERSASQVIQRSYVLWTNTGVR